MNMKILMNIVLLSLLSMTIMSCHDNDECGTFGAIE